MVNRDGKRLVRDSTLAVALSLFAGLAGATAAETSPPESRVHTNLPPQALATALHSLALQRQFQIIFASKEVSALRTRGAVGELTVEEALDKILSGTGLTYCHLDDSTVAITLSTRAATCVAQKNKSGEASAKDTRTTGADSNIRQQMHADPPESGHANFNPANLNQASSPQEPSMSHKSPLARIASILAATFTIAATAQTPSVPAAAQLEEVVVTGSRLQTAGFNAPTPVTVIGAETIEQRAPANIADVINEQPAFRISQTDTTRNTLALPQFVQNTLDLRSLGAIRTLTLINGHRAVATNWTGTVDSNIVPVGLVERVEVVTGGASAAYGSDAVAGVANIILRDKMQGITANLQTGLTEYGAGKQYTAAFAGGTAFASGRAQIIGGIDYNRSDGITNVYGKTFGANEIATIQPSTAQRAALGLPQFVITTNVEPGTSAPGGLYQQSAGVAYTFDASGNPVRLNQGTIWGTQQFMSGSTANYGYNTGNVGFLRIPTSRLDAYGRLSYQLTDRVTAFLEASNSHNKIGPFKQNDIIFAAGGANAAALTISRTSPFVTPAILALVPITATTFNIGRINTEIGGGTFARQSVDSHRIVAGLQGALLSNWKWEAYFQSGRTKLDFQRNDPMYPAFQKAVNGCADTTTGLSNSQRADIATYEALSGKSCVPFNPFGVGRNAASAIDYFNYATRQIQSIQQDVFAASLSGSPFKAPAGDVELAAGAELRREHIFADSDPVNTVGNLLVNNLVEFAGGYNVKEGFLEIGVPVVKNLPFAKSLDFNAAARRTNYELSGAVTTWKAGFTWEPLDSVRVRFTRSRDIRAPTYFDLFLIGGQLPGTVINRIPSGVIGRDGSVNVNPAGTANTVSRPVIQVGSGGGTGLRPEIADTTTGGIVFQRGAFRTSLDYYQVQVADAIASPGFQGEIDLCRDGDISHCQNIIFDSTVTGGIRLVEQRAANLNTVTVSGYDFEAAYRRPMLFGLNGNLTLRALVNYAPHNKTYNPLTRLTTENSNTVNAQPRLGYNLSVGYEVSRYDFNLQFRGFGSRRGNPLIFNPDGSLSANTVLGPEDPGYVVTNNNTINQNRFGGQFVVNSSLNVKINDRVSVFGNIDNLFDVGPVAQTTSNVYDLIGRRYRVGVRARW